MDKKLHLVLKHIWFDMIASGQKLEEYRTINPYWYKRIMKFIDENPKAIIVFHRGYTNVIAEVEFIGLDTGVSNPKWSENGIPINCFILKLGKVIKKENWTYREVSFNPDEARRAYYDRMSIVFKKHLKKNRLPVVSV
jgi:hypothetical protein